MEQTFDIQINERDWLDVRTVNGEPVEVIGSGVLVQHATCAQQVNHVLSRYGVRTAGAWTKRVGGGYSAPVEPLPAEQPRWQRGALIAARALGYMGRVAVLWDGVGDAWWCEAHGRISARPLLEHWLETQPRPTELRGAQVIDCRIYAADNRLLTRARRPLPLGGVL